MVTPTAYKLPDIDLSGNLDVETAAKLIFRESAHHLKTNFRQFKKNEDAAALMQIRIGVRRIRVALNIFRQIIPKEVRTGFNREFRYFGNLLGDARNMDVFLNGTLAPGPNYTKFQRAEEELLRQGKAVREDEYETITREIFGGHFERTTKAFDVWRKSNWAEKLGRSARKVLKDPIAPFALVTIDEGSIALLNQGADVTHLSAAELHDIRKYIKKSRYHLRFFASLFHEQKLQEGFTLLVQMQDRLGHINDVKEGMIILGRLSAWIRADYFSDVLLFNAKVFQDASREVNQHLEEFLNLWSKYEDFSLDKSDLRIPG
ncbi:CHAD domain-containing protein [Sneathiella sp.]|uniref:CHAD domain-containing protein n=1 Tax=Sneathiella sp. TaxID=1964365 RepID=UPI003561A607